MANPQHPQPPRWSTAQSLEYLGDAPVYEPIATVRASRLDAVHVWLSDNGSEMAGQPGDWLVTDGKIEWTIQDPVFRATYALQPDGSYRKTARIRAKQLTAEVAVETLEGDAVARPGDWLVTNQTGECYPVPPEVFAARYRESP
jgi:hypothetical protein